MHDGTINRTSERAYNVMDGGFMLLVFLASLVGGGMLFFNLIEDRPYGFASIPLLVAAFLILCGFYSLQPNEAAAISLFGNYKGTDRKPGLRWILPWYSRKKISLRMRNFTSQTLKVNDKGGNPIEIAANVVWAVKDTGQALFDVDDYTQYIHVQIETAVREIARHYAYDHGEHHEPTLRADGEEVAHKLKADLQTRVEVAGILIDDTKLSHLAYAPEIAGAMLKRQQAQAVLAARAMIVNGAVGMVEQALQQLSERNVVTLDDERRAAMVSNLLVVLCADREAQPVVNAGTLYT